MSSVFSALGLEQTIDQIVSELLGGQYARVLIRGRSGTGKTSFCKEITEKLVALDFDSLTLRGDIGRSAQEYYPFFNLVRSRTIAADTRGVFEAATELLPSGGGIAKRAIESVASYSESSKYRRTTLVHDAVATEIIATLRGRLRRRRTLLILDDVQAFDSATTKVLEMIVSAPADYLGKHSNRLYILASENSEEAEQNPSLLREGVLSRFRAVELERCSWERFPALLAALGFTSTLGADTRRNLYLRSGGHLRVLAELSRHISSSRESIDLFGNRELLELVLTLRLAEPGAVDRGVRSILARIAILGTSFSRMEVQCLVSDVPPPELNEALRKSVDLSLLQGEGPLLSFPHTSIRDFFLRVAPREQSRYHEIFASCLRALRPSDYAGRAYHLSAGGHETEADLMRVLGWSRASRNGRFLAAPVFRASDYTDFVKDIRAAHELVQAGEEREAIQVLESIHDAYPDVLLIERDVMLAECYLEDVSYESFNRALTLLERWQERTGDELELHARVLYLVALAHTLKAEYNVASTTFVRLMRVLASVRQTDPGLQRLLNRIQLVSDCLHAVEISGRKIYSALQALLTARAQGQPFNPVDLYVALTNYSGNQIIAGEYLAASQYALAASDVRDEYQDFRFPSPLAALNNHLIADLLNGVSSPAQTHSAYQELIDGLDAPDEHVLLCVNHANVLCMTGRLAEAAKQLEAILYSLERKGECDEYFIYYTRHALAAALLLMGEPHRAKMMWDSLVPLFTKLPPGLQEYLPHRHKLLQPAFEDPAVTEPRHWDEYLSGAALYRGKPWRFFQRGFLFSDIQFWFHL